MQRNTRLVWDETIEVMADLFDNVWGNKEQIVLDHALDLTMPVSWYWPFIVTSSSPIC